MLATGVEHLSSTKKRLTIEIPADVIEKEYSRSLNNILQKAKIPGFRQGKAPVNLIEKKFGGDIRSDILDKIIPDHYSKTMQSSNLSPVGMPEIDGTLEIKRNEPLVFSLTVEVRPEISDLTYAGLKAEDVPVSVTEAEVEETIKGLQDSRAMYEVVDREVREDDLLVLDYLKLDPAGEKEITSAKDQVMNLGNNLVPKGISGALIGRKKGDVVDITLPEIEEGQIKETAGDEKGNRLKITIKEVKEKKVPPIDDELAKDFGHDSLAVLRDKVTEGLLRNKKDDAESKQKAQLLEELIERHTFDLPESLLARELETLVLSELHAKQKAVPLTPEAAADAQDDAPDPEKIAAELRPKAMRNVKSSLLLEVIADKEKIEVTEEEIKKRIALLARHFKSTPDAVVNLFMTRDGSLEGLSRSLREEKVLDLVLAKAEIGKGASA
ncbi:MAG: trigger factor [Thermodesulfovibrio sp.]|nr:trigger factor [Thermodesulfovibrio sp.]